MKKSHVKELIHDIFDKIGGDLNKSTKDNLLKVLENLKKQPKVQKFVK